MYGPRQVGKTYLLEEFGRREYRDLVKIDFLYDEDAQRHFGSVRSADRVIELVSLAAGHELVQALLERRGDALRHLLGANARGNRCIICLFI